MTTYFNPEQSSAARWAGGVDRIINIIANRYIGANPECPFTFRAFSKAGIQTRPDGRYDLNLNQKLAGAQMGQIAYAYGKFWSETERNIDFSVSCYGPARIYLNSGLVFKSNVREDVNLNQRKQLSLLFQKGWNVLLIKCVKTASGFGCIFGPESSKWDPVNILSPFAERQGQAGWVFSQAVAADYSLEENQPEADASESSTGLRWFPEMGWPDQALPRSPWARIFGGVTNCSAFAWSKLANPVYGENLCLVSGRAFGPMEIWLNGQSVYKTEKAAGFQFTVRLSYGRHDLLAQCQSVSSDDWGLSLSAKVGETNCPLGLAYPVKGSASPWLYLGPFSLDYHPDDVQVIQRMDTLFHGLEDTYWRVDAPEAYIRPFLENELFGRWNYPLGVTLYGLLQAGRVLKRQDFIDYVTNHINLCVKMHSYALWDKANYGYSGINNQLVELDMLDDCGSFGSTMLEAYPECKEPAVLEVAELIADHMQNKQERLPDGAFYRECPGLWLEKTLWVDDLYMSTPFMIRYAKLTGKTEFLDDAARQFLLFKKYLFIPEYRIMSHVYDFKYQTPTYVPWGRGNGWAAFSLSELLAVIPEDHPERGALLEFFKELCQGILALQGPNGLWHQVLTAPDSYEETSCTAMFAYAFARGVRYGWLDPGKSSGYINAAFKGWNGLTEKSIDQLGNVHGVCRGSMYSFTPEYYTQELLWITNDTHGIGIVILAGIEISKLDAWLAGKR